MSQAFPTRIGPLTHEHAASDIISATPQRAIIADDTGSLAASDVTDTELGCLAGVTSAVQTQLDAKAAASHTHALAELADVAVASPAGGEVLRHDGTSWTNQSLTSSDIEFDDIVTDATIGVRVATAVDQKLGFWGVTPVVQPAGDNQLAVSFNNLDSDFDSLPIGASYDPVEIQALRAGCEELADDVRALAALVHALRSALVATGLIKGSS